MIVIVRSYFDIEDGGIDSIDGGDETRHEDNASSTRPRKTFAA